MTNPSLSCLQTNFEIAISMSLKIGLGIQIGTTCNLEITSVEFSFSKY